jgi:hypothetical protein
VAGLCAILAFAIFAAAAAFFSAVAAIFAAFAAFFSAAFFSFSAFCIFPSSVTLYTGLFSFGIPRNPSTREGAIITHVTKSIINRNIIAFIIPLSNMVVAIYIIGELRFPRTPPLRGTTFPLDPSFYFYSWCYHLRRGPRG